MFMLSAVSHRSSDRLRAAASPTCFISACDAALVSGTQWRVHSDGYVGWHLFLCCSLRGCLGAAAEAEVFLQLVQERFHLFAFWQLYAQLLDGFGAASKATAGEPRTRMKHPSMRTCRKAPGRKRTLAFW
jgi:hypothetical protein